MAIYSHAPTECSAFVAEHPATTVLVAEDPFVSHFLRTVLQRYGHNVLTAPAWSAREMLRQGGVDAGVVITNRPEIFLEFADRLHLLYTAATPDVMLAARFRTCRVLRKPFHNQELLSAVEDLAQPL